MERIAHCTLILLTIGLGTASALADEPSGVNQIATVEVVELSEGTSITIMGSTSPTFSVYRLDNPARLFIDFSNTEIAGDITNWSVEDGLVDEILVLQYQDDHSLVTRVVVSLLNDEASYDIETRGNDVVAMILGERMEQGGMAYEAEHERQVQAVESQIASLRQAAQEAEEQAQLASAAALNAEAEHEEAALRAWQLEQERQSLDAENEELRRRTAEAEARAQEVLTEYEEALRSLQGYQEEIARQRQNLETLNSQSSQWQTEVTSLRSELAETRSDLHQRDQAIREAMSREAELRQAVQLAAESQSGEEAALARQQEQLSRDLVGLRAEYQELVDEADTTNQALVQAEQNLAQATDRRSSAESRAQQSQARMEEIQQYVHRLELEAQGSEQDAQTQRQRVVELEASIEATAQRELESRRQAETFASELVTTQDELDQARMNEQQMRQDLSRLETRSQELERQIDELEQAAENEQDRRRLQQELSTVQAELDEANTELQQAMRMRQQYEQYTAEARGESERAQAELEEAIDARQRAQQEAGSARAELERTQEILEQRQVEQQRVDRELAQAVEQRDSLSAELAQLASDQLQQEHDLLQAQSDLAELQAQAAALAEEQAQTRQELEAARSQRQQTAQDLERLEVRRQEVSVELTSAQDNLARILDQQDQVSDNVSELQSTLSRLQAERAQAESSLAQTAQERERMATEIREMEETLQLLETQQARPVAEPPPPRTTNELAANREPSGSSRTGSSTASEATSEDGDNPGSSTPSAEPTEVAITDVRFEQVRGIDRIIVEYSAVGAQAQSLPWNDGRAGLFIEGVTLPPGLRRTLDTRAFEGPVQSVSSYVDDAGQVHLLAELRSAASEILTQQEGQTVWEFTRVASAQVEDPPASSQFEGYNSQEEPVEPPAIGRSRGVSYTIGERSTGLRVPRLSRRLRVTIDLVNADIQNVLRLFSDQGDVNIIASGAVSGTISLRLRGVPLDQAFALILQSQGLGWEQHGNIIRVAPIAEFEAERQRELQRIAEAFDVEPLQVRLRPVSYADGGQMLALLGDVLSERGTASFDDRTHTLILTDVAENLDAAEQLIDALDRQTPQVLIEARIVQSSEHFSRGFGIQWGGDGLFSAANGNATGLLFPSTIGIAGGAGQTPADGTASTPNFAVNVPSSAAGAIGFQLGSLGQAVNLNLRLSAAEASGNAKVISAPRILTLDGQAASISTGLSIPVQTVGAAGTNVTFVQANLSLAVTPTVTPDGFVHLALNITKNEPDFARTGANGDPSIITRTATTQLLVRDGETSVIGGIFEHLAGSDQTGVPILSDIPILGVLFHNYSFQDERNETLVFITPRIVNRELSLANYAPGEVLMTPPE